MNWAYGGSSYPLGYSLESGLLVEEATTNLCTANVSTGGDTSGNTTGFTLTTGAVLSITTDYYKCGTKSLKIVTDGSASMQGALTTVSVTAGQSYTFSSWIKAPLGIIFMLYIGGTTTIYTGTGDWQYCKCTFTAGATTVYPSVITWTPQATTMYVDMVQLEQKAYPTSWTLGGTTRNAETMTIPSSVLNIDTSGYSNLLTANQVSVETDTTGFARNISTETLSASTDQAKIGTKSLKIVTPNGVAQEGIYMNLGTAVATNYTFSGWVYADNGVEILCGISQGSITPGTTDTTLTGNGGWQEFSFNKLLTSAALYPYIVTKNQVGTTFYIDQLQVSATSSARPWIPGGSQVNNGSGTIECEVLIPSLLQDCPGVVGHNTGNLANNRIDLFVEKTDNKGTLTLSPHYGGNTQAKSTGAVTSYVGTWHKFALRWDLNSMQVFLDGVAGMAVTTMKLPTVYGTLEIGGMLNGLDTGYKWNSLIRNVVVSKTKRSDSEIAARASNTIGFGNIDRYTAAQGDLRYDLTFKGMVK